MPSVRFVEFARIKRERTIYEKTICNFFTRLEEHFIVNHHPIVVHRFDFQFIHVHGHALEDVSTDLVRVIAVRDRRQFERDPHV